MATMCGATEVNEQTGWARKGYKSILWMKKHDKRLWYVDTSLKDA